MDILAFTTDFDAIENGRWVGGDELDALGDARVMVRGVSCKAFQKAHAERIGAADDTEAKFDILADITNKHLLLDVEGLTANGQPLGLEAVRKIVSLPAGRKLANLIVAAAQIVDQTRLASIEALSGN